MRPIHWALVFGAITALGCKREAPPADASRPAAEPGPGSMTMGGMPMGAAGMMPMMRAHLDSVTRMPAQQMSGMIAAHEQMLSEMMDRMGADMRGMHMTGDAQWTALTDSVKTDLAELPALQGNDLAARLRAHAARVERLMAMHEGMMKGK